MLAFTGSKRDVWVLIPGFYIILVVNPIFSILLQPQHLYTRPYFLILYHKMEQMAFDGSARPQEREETDVLTTTGDPYSLVVWNDEVNTFEWVIETLMKVCGHSNEQAEQCAYIIHYQGKYATALSCRLTALRFPLCHCV